jgi:hypothetical protein
MHAVFILAVQICVICGDNPGAGVSFALRRAGRHTRTRLRPLLGSTTRAARAPAPSL